MSISLNKNDNSISNNSLPKSIFKDDNVEILLSTNCLLRNGKIRNFKLKQILEVTEITNGESIFEEKL